MDQRLTDREQLVVLLRERGHSFREIASRLRNQKDLTGRSLVCEATARHHYQLALKKTGYAR